MIDIKVIEDRISAASYQDRLSEMPLDLARAVIAARYGKHEAQRANTFTAQIAACQIAREHLLTDASFLLTALQRATFDPTEVYEVRVQIDQKVLVSGSIEEIVREAFHAGYARGQADIADQTR